jgi:hypothetical protein
LELVLNDGRDAVLIDDDVVLVDDACPIHPPFVHPHLTLMLERVPDGEWICLVPFSSSWFLPDRPRCRHPCSESNLGR